MLTGVDFFLALQQVVTSPWDKEEQEPCTVYRGAGGTRHWISVPVWLRAAEVPSPRCSACLQPALLGRGVWFQAGGGGVSDLLCEKRWGDFLVISDQL